LQSARSAATEVASGDYSVIGGGRDNTASGNFATVGGGDNNTASDFDATVGGGFSNTASGSGATVGGGRFNTASGDYSAIPGGYYLRVGDRSFGFSGQTTATQTDLSGNSNIAAFVDVDLWLYSRDRTQASQLRFYEAQAHSSGPEYVAFQAPNTLTTSTTYTLPADLTAGTTVEEGLLQVDNATGELSWVTPAAVVAAGGAWLVGGNTFVGGPAVRVLGITSTNGDALALYTDNAERVRITATGNVGIGTSSPAATLHVDGTVAFSATATLTNIGFGNDLDLPSNVAVVEIVDCSAPCTPGDNNVNPPTSGTPGQLLFIRYSGSRSLTLAGGVSPNAALLPIPAGRFHAILMYIGGGWRLMSLVY
jgi:hypothetical protein